MPEKLRIQITRERFRIVNREITEGSEPRARFYIMVSVSTLIASFGLVANSTAVVIGAMLVAPLMTPIFGIALALVRGDAFLLGRAMRAEIAGVVLAVAMGFVLGILHPAMEATPEMLSRIHPNLFDLIVALLAGFAGVYAMVDEHISPALPGVAIATAIVPPLANTGLCISMGAYAGAMGSFLLFFANFLSILIVASATFVACGMVRDIGGLTKKNLIRRFGLATIGFIIVAGFLSHSLFQMVQRQNLEQSIRTVLTDELANYPATGMDELIHNIYEDKLFVMAAVHSPTVISPIQVKRIQETMTEKLKRPTELIVRTTKTNDVSAMGSTSQVVARNLNGFFLSSNVNPNVQKIKTAEQIIREYLTSQMGLHLHDIEMLHFEKAPFILATVGGIRKLSPEEIQNIETMIRDRVGDTSVRFVVRFVPMVFYNRNGAIRYEWANLKIFTPEQESVLNEIRSAIKNEFSKSSDFFLTNLNSTIIENTYYFFPEVAGMRLFSQNDLQLLKQKLSETFNTPMEIYVWSKPGVVVTQHGYKSYDDHAGEMLRLQKDTFSNEIENLLNAAP